MEITRRLVYGLTGGMGCGKSQVAKFLSEFVDVAVYDADKIAKEILCDERHSQELIDILGTNVFSDNKIDVPKVAKLVFNNYEMLQKLEKFIHPLTRQAIQEKIGENTKASIFFVEAALIYEGGIQKTFDGVVVVTCDKEIQYERLRKYRGINNKEATKRLNRQMPSEEKVKLADFVIDTTCSLEEVKNKAQRLYSCLKGGVRNEEDRHLPRHF